jgi:hypothetical protein
MDDLTGELKQRRIIAARAAPVGAHKNKAASSGLLLGGGE